MKQAEITTKRVFDVSGWMVLLIIVAAAVAIVMSVFADSVTMFPSEKPGIYLLAVISSGLATCITHAYVWGRKVRWAPPVYTGR